MSALQVAFPRCAFAFDAEAPTLVTVRFLDPESHGATASPFSVAACMGASPVFEERGGRWLRAHRNEAQFVLEVRRLGAGLVRAVLLSHAEYARFMQGAQ